MPRQRQRIVFCDCFDCIDRPEQSELTDAELSACEAVARQEPPPKGLLIVGTGLLQRAADDGVVNVDDFVLPHLNRVVKEGALGMLALRPQPEGERHASTGSGGQRGWMGVRGGLLMCCC